MAHYGKCGKCGKNDLIIENGYYTCKDCGHVGSVKEWYEKVKAKIINFFL